IFVPAQRPEGPPNQREWNLDATASERAARQYDEWTASPRYPGLLQDLFVTRILAPGRVELFRFDPQSRTLVHSEWPQKLSRFRDFCIAESTPSKRKYVEIPDLEDVPAVSFPFSTAPPPNVQVTARFPPPIFGPTGWEIIRLNSTLFQRFLSQ